MKKQLLLTRMLLLVALLVGSVSAWAENVTVLSENFSTNNTIDKLTTAGWSFSSNGCSMQSNWLQIASSSYAGTATTPAFSSLVGNTATLTFKHTVSGGDTNRTLTVTGVNCKVNGGTSTNITVGTSNGNASISITEASTTSKITFSASKKAGVRIDDVVVYYTVKDDLTSFTFSNSTPSVTLEENSGSYEAEYTQTVSFAPNDYTGTISYSIDEENSTIGDNTIADVDENGVVTIVASENEASTIKIKASGTATTKYNAPSDAVYTLTVNAKPTSLGEVQFSPVTGSYYYGEPITISAALAEHIYYTTNGDTPTTSSPEYTSSLSLTNSMTLKALAVKGDDQKIGSITYTLKAPEAPTVSLASGGVEEGTEVELTMGDGGSKVVYTTDGTDPTASSTTYSSAIEINSPITLKAATVDGGNNLSSIVTRTYTIIVNKEVTLWSENFSSYSANDVPSGGTYGYTCHDGGSDTKIYNEALAGGAKPELLVGKTSGYFQATVPLDNNAGNLQLKFKTNAKGITISTTTDGISISGDSSFNTAEEHTVTFTGVTTSMTEVVIKFATNSSDNVRLDDIVLKGYKPTATQPVTIGASGFASYCSTSALDFSEANVNAYKAKVNADNVVLTKLEKVPANVGMILYSDNSGNYNIPVAESAPAVTDNEMIGVTERTQINWNAGGKYNYILQSGQFNKANGGYLKANRAYLSTTYEIAEGKELTIIFDEDIEEENETNGIRSIKGDETSSLRYNLAGQKVSKDYKGIVIINGKKMLNK